MQTRGRADGDAHDGRDDDARGTDRVAPGDEVPGDRGQDHGQDQNQDQARSQGRQRLITAEFSVAWLVNFFQYLVFYLLVTTMALYAVRQFGVSDAAGGFASSAFVVGATLARLVSGYLVDTFGRRRILLAALAIVAAACALYLPTGSFALLIAVRIIHGIAYAFASTAVMAIVQSVIPPARRAEGTGYFALGSTLATAVGPALGLFVVGHFDYATLYAGSLAVAAAGLVLGFFLRSADRVGDGEREAGQPEGPEGPEPAARRPRPTLADVAHPAVVPIGCFMLLVGLGYAGIITYLNGYAEQRDVATGAGLFFVAYAAAMLVTRFTLGRVQDSRGDNIVVYFGLISFIAALVLLAVATVDWQVVVAGVLTGLGYGTLMPAAQAIAVRVVPGDKLATGISTLLLLLDVGVGIGPVILGLVATSAGFGAMYGVLAVIVGLAAVFYHFVHGRHDIARPAHATL
ncbi:MFS transporter [uncultured Corynebacterium sp.]|uniref:MFS transporter n=1 Tax=uncultured Corynebacterium sp. TaxID=159447 RepID=UPI0025E5641F|nr:MFS transporter [uncultured Corynebacterium sp.]